MMALEGFENKTDSMKIESLTEFLNISPEYLQENFDKVVNCLKVFANFINQHNFR